MLRLLHHELSPGTFLFLIVGHAPNAAELVQDIIFGTFGLRHVIFYCFLKLLEAFHFHNGGRHRILFLRLIVVGDVERGKSVPKHVFRKLAGLYLMLLGLGQKHDLGRRYPDRVECPWHYDIVEIAI